jgi:hypothetical protein
MTTIRNDPIDFDAASAAWMANKIRKGPMLYYTCDVTQKNGNPCPHAALQVPGVEAHRCRRHSKKQPSLPGGRTCGGFADSLEPSLLPPTKVERDLRQTIGPLELV